MPQDAIQTAIRPLANGDLRLNELLRVPLYHGTSSIFLEDILDLGLGAKNPIEQLGVLELAREIRPLAHQYLADTATYKSRIGSFERMTDQLAGHWNYQHGQTYLSACRGTAIRYASSNRYGSELLTNTLDFLQLLLDRDVPTVADSLYRAHRALFGLLDISPAPVLIKSEGVPVRYLIDEDGGDAAGAIGWIDEMMAEYPDKLETMLQQTNFRLLEPISPGDVSASLINVTRFTPHSREFVLYELDQTSRQGGETP